MEFSAVKGIQIAAASGRSLKMRFGAPEPLGIWAQLRAAGSNLAVSMCAGPELLGTVA